MMPSPNTFIGQHITAAAITAGSQHGYVDYRTDYDNHRTDYDNLSYELVDPPEQVTRGIRLLMGGFGLVFGAVDFVITPSGEWVLLRSIRPASTDSSSTPPEHL